MIISYESRFDISMLERIHTITLSFSGYVDLKWLKDVVGRQHDAKSRFLTIFKCLHC